MIGLLLQFQSTHPRRVRPEISKLALPRVGFNPRTHVGCDVFKRIKKRKRLCFNPRTHVGCDSAFPYWLTILNFVSIHAPT